MPVPMFTCKDQIHAADVLHFVEAWEQWGIPLEQQLAWAQQYFPRFVGQVKSNVYLTVTLPNYDDPIPY